VIKEARKADDLAAENSAALNVFHLGLRATSNMFSGRYVESMDHLKEV
jgi:hypothetical protein